MTEFEDSSLMAEYQSAFERALEILSDVAPHVDPEVLSELRRRHSMLSEAEAGFEKAQRELDPYRIAARENAAHDGVEIDANAQVSVSDEGASVAGWVWVSKDNLPAS